jgi:hypothetical protein
VYYEPVRLKHGILPAPQSFLETARQLNLRVIFTDFSNTAAALAKAGSLARGLGARITLVVAQVVPYPLPLNLPDVPVEFTERTLQQLATGDTDIQILLCRDREDAIRRALPPDCLVIIGMRQCRWWLSCRERSFAGRLRRDGLRVLVVSV